MKQRMFDNIVFYLVISAIASVAAVIGWGFIELSELLTGFKLFGILAFFIVGAIAAAIIDEAVEGGGGPC